MLDAPQRALVLGIVCGWTAFALRRRCVWWEIGLLATSLDWSVEVTYAATRGLLDGWAWLPGPVSRRLILLWYMGALPFAAAGVALLLFASRRSSQSRLLRAASLGPLLVSAWLVLRAHVTPAPSVVFTICAAGLWLCAVAVSILLVWNNASGGRLLSAGLSNSKAHGG